MNKARLFPILLVLSVLLIEFSACGSAPLVVERPAALNGNRFVQVQNLTGTFEVRQSSLRRFFYGRPSRRQRRRDETLKAGSSQLGQRLTGYVTNGMTLNGFAPAGAESARPPGLVFRGTMKMTLVRGFFGDRARLKFNGELISLADGGVVARGEIHDSFTPARTRRFEDLLAGPLERPIRDWFDTLEREH